MEGGRESIADVCPDNFGRKNTFRMRAEAEQTISKTVSILFELCVLCV
jgi:hypothetical protein